MELLTRAEEPPSLSPFEVFRKTASPRARANGRPLRYPRNGGLRSQTGVDVIALDPTG